MKPGRITKQADGYKVVFDRTLAHPIEKVWDAITSEDLLKLWFTDIHMDFRPGGKITFRFRDKARTETYGEIIRIEEPNLFEFTWEGELATWELSQEKGNKCHLRLTYTRLPEDYVANAPAGFHTLLDRLSKMLDGSREQYPFGTEEHDPMQKKLQVLYGAQAFREFALPKFKPVVIERKFHATPEAVWRALTDKEQMKQWYFDLDRFEPAVGFQFSFPGKGTTGEAYMHRCEVTEVVPLKKLQYSWQYDGLPGYSVVTFEIMTDGEQTLLRLTHEGLETFPQSNPDFARDSFTGGWTELITKLLPTFLGEGRN